jgi:CheY-like chemotaxis protein
MTRIERGSGTLNPLAVVPNYRSAILAVELDALLLRTIRRHMSGYDVLEANASDDVLALVNYHQPIALLIDRPYEDAPLPAWLDDMPFDLPIVQVSIPGSLKGAQALGIKNYLIKPVMREQLLDAIAALGAPVHSILIVDDDPDLVALLGRMLQSSGNDYDLRIAYQGIEALGILMQQTVDLVLMDMVMPELGGMDVLFAMKQEPALASIPVIVISGQPTEEISPETGLNLKVIRRKDTSLTEVLTCLTAVVKGLPPRDPLPFPLTAPGSPKDPAVLPVS